jgi:hypothetical protein
MTALNRGFPEVIALNFVPAIHDIHATCLARSTDPYHRALANEAVQETLQVWWAASKSRARVGGAYDPHQQLIDLVRAMAASHFAAFKHPDVAGNDIISELATKASLDKPTLQDIFVMILWRENAEKWQRNLSMDDLAKLTNLIGELSILSKKSGVWNAEGLCAALYEIGYLSLFKLPADYRSVSSEAPELPWAVRPSKSPECLVVESLFTVWAAVARTAGSENRGLEWHQSLVGLLGLGMLRYEDQPVPWLKSSLENAISAYTNAVSSSPDHIECIEDPWSYLQLVGAWCAHFLSNNDLASEIVSLIAERRGIVRARRASGRGRYTWLGYPAMTGMDEDFYLPWLRNLQPTHYLNSEDWSRFQDMQRRLMNNRVLMPFYEDLRRAVGEDQ